VAPPPLPEDDEALSGPPPLPDEPTTMGGGPLARWRCGVLGCRRQTTVPIEQYLPMREKQGWSVQPPLPPHCESAAARAVHEAAAAALYGDANARAAALNRDELRSALDELLAAIGGGVSTAALERVRDAALRVIPVGAAAGRDRDDVLRGMRCVWRMWCR
jgi:hypothetical protein